MVLPRNKAKLLIDLSYVRTRKYLLRPPFKSLAFNDLFLGSHSVSSDFKLKWKYERLGYLVSFGPINLILGVRYDDASQDRFDPYRETASMRYLLIGKNW